jgi:hypothetical protein
VEKDDDDGNAARAGDDISHRKPSSSGRKNVAPLSLLALTRRSYQFEHRSAEQPGSEVNTRDRVASDQTAANASLCNVFRVIATARLHGLQRETSSPSVGRCVGEGLGRRRVELARHAGG